MERNLTKNEMSGVVVKINDDVNGDGEYTLLDLGVDARHIDKDFDSNNNYTMDVVFDGKINRKDLDKIKDGILRNKDYYNFEKK